MLRISSSQNPIIKEVKALRERKHRDSLKKYFIEGKKIVAEAFSFPSDVDYILISEFLENSNEIDETVNFCSINEKKLIMVPDKVFSEISDTKTPQGFLAVMNQPSLSIHRLPASSSFIIILDSLQDPGNLGAIIRTADAAGVDAIFLSKGSVDIYNPKVLRSTMGSIFHLPIYRYDSFIELKIILQENKFKLLTTHLKGDSNLYDLELNNPIAIIIGNEANGVSSEIANDADYLVKIPMPGKAESLNASVAASIIVYECLRQRDFKKD